MVDEGNDNYRVDFLLKGALYKMIRSMVGTVIDVCRGNLGEERFQSLVLGGGSHSRDNNRCKPAPPQGLTLEHVYFDDENF